MKNKRAEDFQAIEINSLGVYRLVPEDILKELIDRSTVGGKLLFLNNQMTLGQIIKNYRDIRGLKQRELAEKIKITNASMCNIENGTTKNPSAKTLKKMCDVFGDEFKVAVIELGFLQKKVG